MGQTRGHIEGRQRKCEGFDEDGSGSRRQTDAEVDKGRTEAAENGGREMAASRARVGSLHNPSSGIRLPLLPSCLCSEVEEQEVTVLASDLEVA